METTQPTSNFLSASNDKSTRARNALECIFAGKGSDVRDDEALFALQSHRVIKPTGKGYALTARGDYMAVFLGFKASAK